MKILLLLVSCAIVTGCDEFGWNPLDPEALAAGSTNQSEFQPVLLDFSVPTLNDSASFFDERRDPDRGLLLRRRTWQGPPEQDVLASLIDIRRLDGTPMTEAPPVPSAARSHWPRLEQRQLVFQTLYASENAVGTVQWRRFVMGPQICVLFTQAWGPDEAMPLRHLLGFYCAPSGQELSDGQAETVVRSVRVYEGDPTIDPNG